MQNAMSQNIGHTETQGNVIHANANMSGGMGGLSFNQQVINQHMGGGLMPGSGKGMSESGRGMQGMDD